MIKLLLLSAFVAGSLAVPIKDGRCSKECTETTKHGYQEGVTYEYIYEGQTVTKLQGSSEEHAALFIRATAKFEVISKCEFALKLGDVTLEEADTRDLSRRMLATRSEDFKRHLESSAIKFSFQDGAVTDVCASPYDPAWVVNVKRGVISSFQNTMLHFDHDHSVPETDVSGKCEAHYKVTRDGSEGKTFSKHKNLLGCTERNKHVSSLKGTPYETDSGIQSLPFMKSFHECEMIVNRQGILTKSECKENHVFRPFSNDKSGASTKTQQTLTYLSNKQGTPSANEDCSRRTNLLFEHSESPNLAAAAERVSDILTTVCNSDDVRPETPAVFSRLVFALRAMNRQAIERIMATVHQGQAGCSAASKYLHDAIPMVGTAASVAIIRDSVLSGHVIDSEAEAWLASLAFVSNVNKDMVMNVRSLLERADRQKAMLSASALVNSYCRSTNCQEDNDIKNMVKGVVSLLSSAADERQKLVVLKAIANIGIHADNIDRVLREAISTSNPTEVRVAAMHAFHKMCCKLSREDFLPVFMNTDEDSEIRINAYLALMKCPSIQLIEKVISVIQQERLNHVTSFVTTHLMNLKETSDPFSQTVRKMLDEKDLPGILEKIKGIMAKNYEGSLFSDMLNLGGKAESNVIYSSDSYVPRSANLDLTVNLFGHSVNLLEVGGRVEGAETLMEKLFGADGYFPNSPLSDFVAIAHDSHGEAHDSLKGSVYLKIYGNELRYHQIGNDHLKSAQKKLSLLDIMTALARGTEFNFDKNFMFMDTSFTLPTVVGLPIHMVANGTVSVRLGVAGKLEMTSIDNIDINGAIKPSAAVQVASVMTVDAFVVRPGLKMVSTLHTSTQADVSLMSRNKHIIKADIKLPKDKDIISEFINAETKFFIMHQGEEREQAMMTDGRVTKELCTGDILQKALGLQFCGKLSFRNATNMDAPGMPLTGPMMAQAVLKKVDSHSGYSLQAQMRAFRPHDYEPASAYVAHFSVDTPGSQIDRKLLFDFKLDKPSKILELKMASPWKKFAAQGSLVNTMAQKQVKADVRVDGIKKINFIADLQVEQKDGTTRITPSAELMLPGRKLVTVQGLFIDKPGELNEGELRINNITEQPILLKGSLTRDIKSTLLRMDSTIDVSTPMSSVKGSLFVEMERGLLRTEADVGYRFGSMNRERLSFTVRMKNTKNSGSYRSVTNSELKTTQFPQYNWRVDVESVLRDKAAKTTVDIRYSRDLSDQKKRIYFNHAGFFNNKDGTFQMSHEAQFTYKAYDLQFEGKLEHQHDDSEVKTTAILNYNDETANLNIDLKKNSNQPLKVTGEISMAYPGREIRIRESLEQKSQTEFHNDFSLQWQRGAMVRSTVVFTMADGGSYSLIGTIELPDKNTVELDTQVTLNIYNFMASSKVTYKNRIYSGLFKYAYNHMSSLTANFDFVYPKRHIISDVAFTSRDNSYNVEIKTLWDADKNPNMKFSLDGSVRYLKGQELELVASAAFIGYKWRLNLGHQKDNDNNIAHLKVYWSDKKGVEMHSKYHVKRDNNAANVQVDISVKTPFAGYESQSGMLAYTRDNFNIQSRLTYTFSVRKTIAVDFNVALDNSFSSMNSAVIVATPFKGFDNIKMMLDFTRTTGKLDSKFEYTRLGKVYDAILKYERSANSLHSSLKIGTPIRGMKSMEFSIAREMTRRNMNTIITGKLQKKTITLTIQGKFKSIHKMEGKVTVQTPFMDDIVFHAKHSQNGKILVTDAGIQWSQTKKIILSNNLKYQSNGAELKFKLATPYEPFKSFIIHIDHSGISRLPISTSVNISCDGYASFNSRFQLSDAAFLATFELDSPMMNPFRVSVTFDKSKLPISTNILVRWQEKEMRLEGEMAYYGINLIKGNMMLTTPFSPVQEVSLSIDHSKVNNEWRTVIETARESVNKIQFYSTISAFRAAIKLQSSYQHMKSFQITTRYDSYLQSAFALAHEAAYGKTEFQLGLDCVLRRNKYSGFFKLDTPNELIRDLFGQISHEIKRREHIIILEAGYKQKNINFDAKLNLESPKLVATLMTPFDVVSKVAVNASHEGSMSSFANRIQVVLESTKTRTFNSDINVNGFQAIQGHIHLDEFFSATFTERMSRSQLNSKLEMTVLGKSAAADLKLKYSSLKGIIFKITTPFDVFNKLDIEGTFQSIGNDLKLNNSLIVESDTGRTVAWESQLQFNKTKSLKLDWTLTSPLLHSRNIGFAVNHDMSNVIRTSLNLNVGNHIGGIESVLNMQGTYNLDIKTPFEGYQDISLSSEYQKNGNAHTGKVTLKYTEGKEITMDGLFSLKPITMEITVMTPYEFCKDASFRFKHVGTIADFTSTALLKHNLLEKDIEEKLVFKMTRRNVEIEKQLGSQFLSYQATYKQRITRRDIDVQFLMTITSPNIQDGKVQFTHKGLFNNFKSEMEISANGNDYLDLDVTFDIENYKTKIEIETAHFIMKKAGLEFFHNGTIKDFENELKISYNDYDSMISSSFKVDTGIDGRINLVNPLILQENLEIITSHSSLNADFQHNTIVKYGNQQHTLTASLTTSSPIQGRLQLRSPLTEDFEVSVDLNSNLQKFDNVIKVQYGKHTLEYTDDINFAKKEGSFDLKIPFQKIGNVQITMAHRHVDGKFVTEAAVTYGDNQVYSFTSNLQTSPVNMLITIETPHTEIRNAQLTLTFNMDASSSFNLDVNLKLNQAPLASLTVTNDASTFEGRMTMQPSQGPFRNTDIHIKHEGRWQNFKSIANVVTDEKTYFDGEMTFVYDRVLQAEIKAKSAIEGFEQNTASLYYKMTKRLFDFKLMASRNERVIKSEINLKMKPSYELTGKVQTPYKYMKDLSINVNHNPNARNIVCSVDHIVEELGTFKFNLNVETNQNIDGTVFLRTPLSHVGDASMTFTHSGSISDFTNNLQIETIKGNVAYQGEFRLDNGASGKFTITTPISQMRNTQLEFNVNPQVGTIFLQSDRAVDIRSKYSLQGSPSVTANVRIQTALQNLENIEFNLSHEGNIEAFNSYMDMTYKRTRLISARIQGRKTPLYGNLDVSIHKLQDIKVEFSHQGTMENIQTLAKVMYGRHSGQATMTFSMQPVIDGKLILESPFHEPVLFKLIHQGGIVSFRNTLEGTYGSKTATILTKLSFREFSIEVTTPFSGYENFNVEFANNGDPLNFQMTATVSFRYVNILKLTGQYQLTSNPRMGKFELIVPANNILMTIKHDGSWTVFTRNVDLTYNGKKFIEYEATMSQMPFEGNMRLYTPMFDVGTIRMMVKHDGSFSNFRNTIKFSRNSMRYTIDTTLETNDMLNLKIEISTPFASLSNLKAILTHSGPIYDFKDSLSIVVNSNELYALTTLIKFYPTIEYSLKVETPNYEFRELEFTFAHKGDIYKYFTTWAVHLNGERRALWQATFDASDMEGTMIYRMPYREDITGNFNIDGTLMNFTSYGEIGYGSKKAMASFGLTTSPVFSIEADFNTVQ